MILADNYPPVSLTYVAGRLLEKFVAIKSRKSLKMHQLLGHQQHDFRKVYLCPLNLVAGERWSKPMTKDFLTLVIHVDFHKLVDKVPHRRLIAKMKFFAVPVRPCR